MAEQLALPLPSREALGRDDFFVSPANAAVLTAVESWAEWPGGKLAVVGPKGSGKTHLAHVFAAMTGARVIQTIDDPDTLSHGPLVIDRADEISDEPAFFHLYNRITERGQPLLLTSRSAPARWSIALPDLASRLGTIPVAELLPPDDALLTAVLAKAFMDRGIAPPPKVIPMLLARMERSLGEASELVAALDAAALATGRAIGPRLAGEVLDKRGFSGA